MVQSRDAFVYHLTCRGHRWNKGVGIVNDDYESTMNRCRQDFIRKWGDWIKNDEFQFPIINPKYNIGIILDNNNKDLLYVLEPWCSNIYCGVGVDLRQNYITNEQSNTSFNLSERVLPFSNEKNNEIIITIDSTFTQQDFQLIQQLPAIIKDSGEIGEFELGNLKIEVTQMKDYVNDLISL
tara:strand:- start:398 stop:940 length:543 start_codon:yes stop_codon:yes gene_type:complete